MVLAVPAGLAERLGSLTGQGYRVLAAARRVVAAASLPRLLRQPRADMERELIFAGLIVMENRLKPQTQGVIRQLQDASIKVAMVTGQCGPVYTVFSPKVPQNDIFRQFRLRPQNHPNLR